MRRGVSGPRTASEDGVSGSGINRDEWLKALTDAGYGDPKVDDQGALTIAEYAEMMQVPLPTAASHLRSLERRGKATRTQKWGTSSYGRRISYVAYRLVK